MDKSKVIFSIRRFLFIGVLFLLSLLVFIDNIVLKIIWLLWTYVLVRTYADDMIKGLGLKPN